mmetsp:Transcript_1200/g.2427  ORF Transcript_1200/g.2427 Transcript_1200/m.2427 type:complete len:82 (+) Transcript_1200:288-533(+)
MVVCLKVTTRQKTLSDRSVLRRMRLQRMKSSSASFRTDILNFSMNNSVYPKFFVKSSRYDVSRGCHNEIGHGRIILKTKNF